MYISHEVTDEDGEVEIVKQRIKFNENMNLCFEFISKRYVDKIKDNTEVSGMIFRTYSELDLYELEEINT